MSIKYQPDKVLEKMMPKSRIKKMMTDKLTLKKTAFKFIDRIEGTKDLEISLDKKSVTDVALKTVKSYQLREREAVINAALDRSAGVEFREEQVDDPKQLIQRVQNEVVFQIHNGIKKNYEGEKYVWLPSDADEPDPEHQLNYGKTFTIGVGEMPGDRYGCRCGMEILTEDDVLELD